LIVFFCLVQNSSREKLLTILLLPFFLLFTFNIMRLMKHLYAFRKIAVSLTIGLMSYSAIAQVCGPVVQNFDNTGGTMAGFSSSTFLSTASGFTYGQTGQNGYLQRCSVPSPRTVFEIATPTFQPTGTPTFIGYGFELSGAVAVSDIAVYFQYVDNSNNVNSVLDTIFVNPTYSGSGGNATLTICDSFLLSRATGFTPGERYRIVIELTTATASNNNQCIVFDNFRTTGSASAAALPVSFTGFAARKVGSAVELIWNVAGERDVQQYEIERSGTGADFTKLGEVVATNSSAYSFMDNQPLAGISFYRIKETDVDGKFKYSMLVRLNLTRDNSMRVYPSPAKDEVTIEHPTTSKGTITIGTSDGRLVRQLNVGPDAIQTTINISNLKAGLYIVRFTNESGQTQTVKLVKE
jgi:Secretion system C-terminal sorting domain